MKLSTFQFSIVITAFLTLSTTAQAQLKLGTNPTSVNANSILEMETTNKGMLLPRVALTNTTNFAPLSAHIEGMTVYNTATAGDVTLGYYFNNGTKWVKLSDAYALQLIPGAGVGKVLTSDAAGLATWQTASAATGSLAGAYNPIGTTNLVMVAGAAEADVPGVTQTFTLTKAATVNVIATGIISNYALTPAAVDIQGSFKIDVDGANMTAAFASSGNRPGLGAMPTPITLSYNVILAAGTHTIKLRYKPWNGGANLNLNAFTAGYGGATSIDADALKSRMSILIFNN